MVLANVWTLVRGDIPEDLLITCSRNLYKRWERLFEFSCSIISLEYNQLRVGFTENVPEDYLSVVQFQVGW